MITTLILIIFSLAALFCLIVELQRDLMMFQQNSYRSERYRAWLRKSGDSTSGWRLCGMTIFFICLTPFCRPVAGACLATLFCIVYGVKLLKIKYKKPLVMTPRAKRLMRVAVSLAFIPAFVCYTLSCIYDSDILAFATGMIFLGAFCGSHMLIMAAATLLSPVEKHINNSYINDAKNRLRQMPELKIIGVTGSYGKTTTKHYLHRILSEQFETLMTPGSFNTTLGVVRTVREYLKPYHEVFIVEMGAKNVGDIKEICDIVNPQGAVITAVGPQHLESFKTIENVQATKFELTDSLPSDGFAVVNNDFDMIASRKVDNAACIRYAVKNTAGADYVATDIAYTPSGTEFTVVRKSDGHSLRLSTRLVGECNISNLLAAVAIAQRLGVPDAKIAYAVSQIEQVEHRLSIKRVPGGPVIIDDAFNSNPVGSAMALDVLAAMKSGKRILVTPGMIELGDQQEELNRAFGRKAASCCDLALVVGRYNREAIVDGLRDGGMAPEAIRTPDTFAEAQQILAGVTAPGDIILYENDLPDTFK